MSSELLREQIEAKLINLSFLQHIRIGSAHAQWPCFQLTLRLGAADSGLVFLLNNNHQPKSGEIPRKSEIVSGSTMARELDNDCATYFRVLQVMLWYNHNNVQKTHWHMLDLKSPMSCHSSFGCIQKLFFALTILML